MISICDGALISKVAPAIRSDIADYFKIQILPKLAANRYNNGGLHFRNERSIANLEDAKQPAFGSGMKGGLAT